MIAVIKTRAQYDEVLRRVADLAATDPIPDSNEGRELELLVVLLRDYEQKHFPPPPPSPIAAIRLRMEQAGLAPRELVPFLGSRSKVSEVLSGKRPLSLNMIRSLHSGLGIPLAALVSEEIEHSAEERIEWDRFPIREMARRGWLYLKAGTRRIDFAHARDLMEDFFKPLGGPSAALSALHKTDHVRRARNSDRFALAAWAGYAMRCADELELPGEFKRPDWNADRLRELRNLSRYDMGPRLAVQYLTERGIAVVIVPHLSRTRLDGAAMLRADGAPVLGLTIRHDRTDNFWFTLFHELMHILVHLTSGVRREVSREVFLDDLDVAPDASQLEREADEQAREALVPSLAWNASAVKYAVAPATVSQLALELGVADAIVAGCVRYETRNYRLLASLIGSGDVRRLFPEVRWPANDDKGSS